MGDELRRIVLEGCVLVAFGALVGLTLNHRLVLDAFAGRLAPPRAAVQLQEQEQAAMQLPLPALLDEVRDAVAAGVLLVDARSAELYAAGHIKGAASLPMVDIDAALPDFMAQVERDRPIIAYCSGFGCPDSFDLGMRLLAEGYRDVRVFEGGFPEWRDAGLPVAEGAP